MLMEELSCPLFLTSLWLQLICYAASLSCTEYCRCTGGEVRCCNQFTIHEEKVTEEAEGNEERDDEDGKGSLV